MGTGAEIAIPLLLAGGATAATTINADRAAGRADRIAAQGIRQQGVRQRDIDARVDQQIGEVAGSDPEMDRRASEAQFLDQLRRSRAAARGGAGVPGASGRYGEDLITGDAAVDSTAARVADLMARTNAPMLQRERELQGFDRLRSDVGTIQNAAGGDAFLNQLRVRAVRPNPWVDALAGIAGGYGQARAYGSASGRASRGLPTGGVPGSPPLPVPAGGITGYDQPLNPWALNSRRFA